MDLQLKDKNIFIAGGSRGIGAAIARALHAEGARLFVVARDRVPLENLKASLSGIHIHCADLTVEAKIAESVAESVRVLGKIDGVVCNLGSGTSVDWGKEDQPEWHRVLGLNLISTSLLIKEATPHLAKSGGSIVCISSICGLESLGAPATYSAAKAALNRFAKDSARPLGKLGVRINTLAPGNVFFEGGVWDRKTKANATDVDQYVKREVPLARFGTPEEIGAATAFLLSPRSSFTTGALLTVDGGQTR